VAAQRSATAIQRLTGAEKYQDYHDALLRLERSANSLRGEQRTAALRRWVAVLKELGTHSGGLGAAGSTNASNGDADWQNLHISPFEGITDGSDAQLAIKANEVLFVDSEHEDEVLTFREVFLGSRALELLLAGFIDEPPASDEEHSLLAALLAASLGGDAELHQELAGLFVKVARQREASQHMITVGEQDLGALVASALGALKLQAGVELLDRKMATLRADISEKAAEAAQVYKFNAGAAHPTQDSSAATVAAGLAATAEVMQLNATLTHLAAQRGALVAAAAAPQFDDMRYELTEYSAETGDSITEVVRRLEATRAQKSEGESYRAAKLAEMSEGLDEIIATISGMEQRKAALLQELEILDQKLFKAKATWADMDEGRNVFEEGNAFTMEAVQQQLDQLQACQDCQVAEEGAVEAAAELLSAVDSGWAEARPALLKAARAVEKDTGREYMHAATRHCYYQRAELQLLLRQLRFCGAELHAIWKKQAEVMDIGTQYFKSIMVDMKASQSRLATKYVQCEAAMLQRLGDLSILRATFAPCRTDEDEEDEWWDDRGYEDAAGALFGAQLRPIPMSEELEDVFQSMYALRQEFEHLPRPQGLPPLGEPLPTTEQVELEASELRDATASETAAAEARLAGVELSARSDGGGSDGGYSDRSLPDDPKHHELPEGTEEDVAAAQEALAASEAAERARIAHLISAAHPGSPADLDVASAAVAAHAGDSGQPGSMGASAVGILAAVVSPDMQRSGSRRTIPAPPPAADGPSRDAPEPPPLDEQPPEMQPPSTQQPQAPPPERQREQSPAPKRSSGGRAAAPTRVSAYAHMASSVDDSDAQPTAEAPSSYISANQPSRSTVASPTAPAARAEPQQREAGALAAQAAAVQAVRPAAHQAAPTAVASQSSQEPSLPTWAEAPPQKLRTTTPPKWAEQEPAPPQPPSPSLRQSRGSVMDRIRNFEASK